MPPAPPPARAPPAPFAILDTIYQGMQTHRRRRAQHQLSGLVVDWGSQARRHVFLDRRRRSTSRCSADLTADTDEFDQHVIAHEFGHYIEYNFSRADNIGGPHGLGDKLDPRVAFGEGFGYAFAAIVLNDPVARDSRRHTGCYSAGFNIETNPAGQSGGAPDGNYGCWCSESSVWSILWDLYDNAADANDTWRSASRRSGTC